MKKINRYENGQVYYDNGVLPYEGESIEKKITRIVDNNEPVTDGAPLIYTEKKDGVVQGYNIRADKWDIAIEAMDAVNKTKVAKSNGYFNENKESKKEEDTKKEEPKKDL